MDTTAHPDWSLLHAFLAVAEEGSLSAAAKRLGTSQPTLGRQIRRLEEELGVELFHRQPRGLVPSQAGAELLEPARTMGAASRRFALVAAGREGRLEGPVRITASEALSFFHLGPILARIREAEPAITFDLVPSDQSSNLLFREADIAIRMFRPTQLDLVTRHLGDMELGAFAADSYIARRGLPRTVEQLLEHDFIGFDRQSDIIDGFRASGLDVDRSYFAVRVDHNLVNWAMIRAGCGIGLAQTIVGAADPAVRPVDLPLALPTLPLWLTAHEAIRRTPRVARVWDLLIEGLKPLVSRADAPGNAPSP